MKTWTKEQALPVMREAFLAEVLAAQRGGKFCAYRSPEGPCIIGVLIDDETAARWDRIDEDGDQDSRSLPGAGWLPTDVIGKEMVATFGNDLDWFATAQSLHDKAVSAVGAMYNSRLQSLREFLWPLEPVEVERNEL